MTLATMLSDIRKLVQHVTKEKRVLSTWQASFASPKLAASVLGIFGALLGSAIAQEDAGERAKLLETFAFANLGAQSCAYALDDASWNAEVRKLVFALKPPLTDDEIAAKKEEVLGFRSHLGEAKWCELYALKMYEAHIIFSMTTNPK
jgi:hypothetical protein